MIAYKVYKKSVEDLINKGFEVNKVSKRNFEANKNVYFDKYTRYLVNMDNKEKKGYVINVLNESDFRESYEHEKTVSKRTGEKSSYIEKVALKSVELNKKTLNELMEYLPEDKKEEAKKDPGSIDRKLWFDTLLESKYGGDYKATKADYNETFHRYI